MRPIVSRILFIALGFCLGFFAAIVFFFFALRSYPQVASGLARLGNSLASADEDFSTSGRLESVQSVLAAARNPDEGGPRSATRRC